MKKILKIFGILFIIFSMYSCVFAENITTQLNVVKESGEVKVLENDQGYITKKITNSNKDTGVVTLETSLNNKTDISEIKQKYENTEIYIMVDENIAVKDELNNYITYIEELSKKVFEKNSKTKIGIIGITGTVKDIKIDENGNATWGDKDEGTVLGSENNAEIIMSLTSDANEIKTSLQNMNSSKTEYAINLQAAIRLASKQYSENTNKILISLFDGVPSIAIGVMSETKYGGLTGYKTPEEALKAKYEQLSSKCNSEILKLKEKNIDFILLRPDDTSYNKKFYDTNTGEFIVEFDGSPYVQKIYGTLERPTYGKMYSLDNESLEKITTEYIYQDIMNNIHSDMQGVIIKEYFSKEILDNFEISFADKTIDTTKLLENGYIEYNVGKIKVDETATLQYELKIKDMKNEKIIDKILTTSEKTEISYIDNSDQKIIATSTSSPQIKLSKVEEKDTSTDNKKDPITTPSQTTKVDQTMAKEKYPNTGIKAIISIFIILIITSIVIAVKYKKLKDV